MALRDLIPWHKMTHRGEPEQLPVRRDVSDLFREVIEDFVRPWAAAPWRVPALARFGPAVDVAESDKEYRVSVELPGMTRDDIEVTISEGRLVVTGEKKREHKEEGEDYLRVERSYGSFHRTIPLPASVDQSAVEASFKGGVLTVRLPKTQETKGKKVQIRSGP